MKKLPKAISELNGGLFVPKLVVDLLTRVLDDHRALLTDECELAALHELKDLLGMPEEPSALPAAREQLDLPDPRTERLARNLLRL